MESNQKHSTKLEKAIRTTKLMSWNDHHTFLFLFRSNESTHKNGVSTNPQLLQKGCGETTPKIFDPRFTLLKVHFTK